MGAHRYEICQKVSPANVRYQVEHEKRHSISTIPGAIPITTFLTIFYRLANTFR